MARRFLIFAAVILSLLFCCALSAEAEQRLKNASYSNESSNSRNLDLNGEGSTANTDLTSEGKKELLGAIPEQQSREEISDSSPIKSQEKKKRGRARNYNKKRKEEPEKPLAKDREPEKPKR